MPRAGSWEFARHVISCHWALVVTGGQWVLISSENSGRTLWSTFESDRSVDPDSLDTTNRVRLYP